MGTLEELDPQGLSISQHDYDYAFYMTLLLKAKTIQQMSQIKMSAIRSAKVYLDLSPHFSQVDSTAREDLQATSNPEFSNCRNLNNYLKLAKNLYYLKNKTYEPF